MPDGPVMRRTIGDLVEQAARRFAHAPALLAGSGRVLSHRQFADLRASQVAAVQAAGVTPGDRVAVALPKSADAAAVSLVLASACCCVPLNPDAPAPELAAALRRTGCRWLVAQPHSPAWQCGQALGLTCIGVTADPTGGFRFQHLPPANRPVAKATPAPGDIALLLQTSGSSAEPKLVPLSHHQLLCAAANLVRSLALGPQDRCLNMLPLFHVGGLVDLLLAPLSVGGSVLVTERIDAREFFAALDGFRPTWYQGVPTMLREVLSLAQLEPRHLADHRLRFIRSVSSALPERLQAELEATFDCPVIAIYGMTETAGVITSNPLPPGRAKRGSVGLPAGPQLRIARADGSWAAAGESGEICVRGDTVIGAYEDAGTSGGEAFFGDWLRTGDRGHLDADGYLFLDGRLKDIINRGGEKIAPLEIDRCLLQHPQVVEAAAFAAPHPTLGEEVALAVVPAPGAALDETALREFLAERLAAHKLPRHIHVLDALPLGRTGKVQRRLLTERLATTVDETPWQAPETPSAQRLTELWQRVLGVERVGMDDDFFNLGGDSLTAVGCTLELQTRYRLALPAGALYDHPTPRALLAYLQSVPNSAELAMFLGTAPTDSRLPADLQAELQRQMHGWRGERSHPHSLLVGQRLDGTRPPLFWVVNGYAELAATVRHLDPQRPVYGMRSLYGLPGDTAANRRALGVQLAEEIAGLQPTGPLRLGGYCAGGRVALEIADALRARGREVALLCLLDTRVHRSYPGDVLLLHTRRFSLGPRGRRLDQRRGYRRYFGGRVARLPLHVRHADVLRRRARRLGRLLGRALRRFDAGRLAWLPPAPQAPAAPPQDACRAEITRTVQADAPLHWRPGERITLPVRLHNRSDATWQPTAQSGLVLAATLRRPPQPGSTEPRGRRRLDGYCPLPVALPPGAAVDLQLHLRARLRPKHYLLEVDVLDDGVAWFGDRGSTPLLIPVRVGLGSRAGHPMQGRRHT